ncbi:hypothetical protein K457DRAFT_21124 [Linnemannia elongata AG-77]|uniref:Uncharacterized protein n=1 Tax=Linnemannia elongata AG-77 TaxID=1314771 RepID=A0A197JSZ4_9FUNG|nr:hypothetical protein K457DRAFT_21124 [Linnemannia elongata AG-77]
MLLFHRRVSVTANLSSALFVKTGEAKLMETACFPSRSLGASFAHPQTDQGISAKDKTSKYTGPRGDWSQGYGYITRDGFCPCGASLATYEDTCPGATKNPRAADERLLESLLGRRKSQVSDRTVTDGWFTEEFGL